MYNVICNAKLNIYKILSTLSKYVSKIIKNIKYIIVIIWYKLY